MEEQKIQRISLKSGDLLYFEPHSATAVLLERQEKNGEPHWSYLLRSPKKSDKTIMLTSVYLISETKIVSFINKGEIDHYESR